MKVACFLRPLYFGSAIIASLSPILYWMVDKNFEQLNKVFPYLVIMAMLIFLLTRRFILRDRLVIFILFYSIVIIIFGVINNPIGKPTFAHLQPLLLIICGLSFGYLIAKNYGATLNKIYFGASWLGVVLSIIIINYFMLYQMGSIPYFGASSLMFVPIIWAILEKKWLYLLIFMIALVLTGKRSGLLAVLIVLLFGMYHTIGARRLFLVLGFGVIMALGAIMHDGSFSVFSRFNQIIEVLLQNEISLDELDIATSGRINDALAAYESINKHWIYWVIGKGIGATFQVQLPTDVWITHYTHFTPLSYIFLGGGVLFVAVYSKIIGLLFYCMKNSCNFYNLLFLNYFVISILGGAIYFTDPFVWIFAGVVIFNKKYNVRHTGNMY